jgi:hypothetical protein
VLEIPIFWRKEIAKLKKITRMKLRIFLSLVASLFTLFSSGQVAALKEPRTALR